MVSYFVENRDPLCVYMSSGIPNLIVGMENGPLNSVIDLYILTSQIGVFSMLIIFNICGNTDDDIKRQSVTSRDTQSSDILVLCRSVCHSPYRLRRQKTCLRRVANNKDTDQYAHPHRLISAFVIRSFHIQTCYKFLS